MSIDDEFDKFFEFPTDDKSQVSSISCKLFAAHIVGQALSEFCEPVAWLVFDGEGFQLGHKNTSNLDIPLYAKKG